MVSKMSNLYLSQELYNEEFKEQFLEMYRSDNNDDNAVQDEEKKEKKTHIAYRYVFQRSYKTEQKLKKDVYDFNDKELYSLIRSYKNGSHAAVQSTISVLKKYLDYCVERGFIRVNLLQDLSGYDDYQQFVDQVTTEQKYIDREQFEQMIAECLNYQDAFPLAMCFYGFRGEGCCEIVNLKVTDVDVENKKIFISSRNESYDIDDYLLNIIINTTKEDEYTKKLTDAKTVLKSDANKIYPNDYVMRIGSSMDNEPVSSINVTARLNRVKEYAGKRFQRLTPKSIWESGLLDKAKSILEQKGDVEKEDWIALGKLYGYEALYWSKYRQKLTPFLTKKISD